jgi:multidrug transporter EmrE-like cation transporter
MSTLASTGYIAAAGFCFMLANLVMKMMGHLPVYMLYPAIAAAFAAGAYCEVEALRTAQLGYAVTIILVCELLFSVFIAMLFFGENYSTGNLIGIAFVMVGITLLSIPAQRDINAKQPRLTISEDLR